VAPALCAFVGAMARQEPAAARRALASARRAGVPRRAAEEAGLMLVLHAGYPAALEGMRVLAEAWPGRARRTREGGPPRWRRLGEARCRQVYGSAYPRLVASVRALHPDLLVWMIEQGYGRVLSRRPLDARARELLAVTVLAAAGWERQLVSHLRGAARAGAAPREIAAALQAGQLRTSRAVRAAGTRAWRRAFGAEPAVRRGG
jgi:4-carboxymuconolactone decarboxylase